MKQDLEGTTLRWEELSLMSLDSGQRGPLEMWSLFSDGKQSPEPCLSSLDGVCPGDSLLPLHLLWKQTIIVGRLLPRWNPLTRETKK